MARRGAARRWRSSAAPRSPSHPVHLPLWPAYRARRCRSARTAPPSSTGPSRRGYGDGRRAGPQWWAAGRRQAGSRRQAGGRLACGPGSCLSPHLLVAGPPVTSCEICARNAASSRRLVSSLGPFANSGYLLVAAMAQECGVGWRNFWRQRALEHALTFDERRVCVEALAGAGKVVDVPARRRKAGQRMSMGRGRCKHGRRPRMAAFREARHSAPNLKMVSHRDWVR